MVPGHDVRMKLKQTDEKKIKLETISKSCYVYSKFYKSQPSLMKNQAPIAVSYIFNELV